MKFTEDFPMEKQKSYWGTPVPPFTETLHMGMGVFFNVFYWMIDDN
jgi:hypothetical protein